MPEKIHKRDRPCINLISNQIGLEQQFFSISRDLQYLVVLFQAKDGFYSLAYRVVHLCNSFQWHTMNVIFQEWFLFFLDEYTENNQVTSGIFTACHENTVHNDFVSCLPKLITSQDRKYTKGTYYFDTSTYPVQISPPSLKILGVVTYSLFRIPVPKYFITVLGLSVFHDIYFKVLLQ